MLQMILKMQAMGLPIDGWIKQILNICILQTFKNQNPL